MGHGTYTHGISKDESHYTVWTAWRSVGVRASYVSTDAQSGSPFEVRRHSYSGIGLLPLW